MSTALSESFRQKSTDELLRLQAKLAEVKRLQAEILEADRDAFWRRYPTPGALAKAYLPATRQTPALDAIDAALVDLAHAPGALGRQMIFVPPQEGKSTRTSCWFPLWMLAHDPTLRIAIVSYSAEKARRWGRWIRRMVEQHPELGIVLAPDSKAVDNWETTAGGRVLSVGVEGGITGEPVDLMVIDDPLHGRAEAESPTYRKRAWQWWESDSATRLSSRARVVLMLTRWHADDLAGRLLKDEPGEWKVLRIPAVRDADTPVIRGSDGASAHAPNGELISVQRRAPGYFLGLKAKRSPYVWRSIYMQTPVAAEGNLYQRSDFRYWQFMQPDPTHHDPLNGYRLKVGEPGSEDVLYVADMIRFITVDLAASEKTSADWTVASAWGLGLNGDLFLLGRERARLGESEHWSLVRKLCVKWRIDDVYIEESFISSTLVRDATRGGMRVQPVKPDKDKVTRAIPAANRVKAHTVFWPDWVDWLDEWCDEIAGFPSWANDDQEDTLAMAARIDSAHVVAKGTLAPPRTEKVRDEEWTSSVGLPEGLDLTRADW